MDFLGRLFSALGDQFAIEGELRGGMARVFLATERALDRRIVLKVLAPEIAAELDAERFRREIGLVARLQHPHIVPLLAAGEADGLLYYTMPYVGGDSLRTRLRDGELPIAEARRLLCDVAAALAYAHRQGVVHRDIKPDNILLCDGTGMVTDFGIARAVSAARATAAAELTRTGTSLGTPTYTAPEQAVADPALDHRADIYALGVVAYEILTGHPPFGGRTPQALLAAHATQVPEHIGARRPTLPPALAALVMQCLEKRPADRPQTAAEVRRALEATAGAGVALPGPIALPPASVARARPWVATALLTAAALVIGIGAGARLWRAGSARPAIAGVLLLEPGPARGTMALAHDGSRLAFTGDEQHNDPLRIRLLSGLAATAVAGTEGARHPFWSPDDRFVGFEAGGELKVVELATGTVRTICPAPPEGIHGTWSDAGAIVFVPVLGGAAYRATVDGAACERLSWPASAESRYHSPSLLPDGRRVLLSEERSGMAVVADLETGDVRPVRRARGARFIAPDRLLFVDRDTLFLQAFDPAKLAVAGEPRVLVADVAAPAGVPSFAASPAGVLVADAFEDAAGFGPMLLVSRRDGATDTLQDPGAVRTRRFSRDGRHIALGGSGLWVRSLRDGTVRALRAEQRERITGPVLWAPGDSMLAYATDGAQPALRTFRMRDSTGERLYETAGRVLRPDDWSPDGKHIVFTLSPGNAAPRSELWTFSLDDGRARLLLAGPGDVGAARFAPDGRWIAYESDEGGRPEVYVRPFGRLGTAVRVSSGGGTNPVWGNDGAELVYRRPGGPLVAVPIRLGRQARVGEPVPVAVPVPESRDDEDPAFDASPDGRWVAVSLPRAVRRTILVNWLAPASE